MEISGLSKFRWAAGHGRWQEGESSDPKIPSQVPPHPASPRNDSPDSLPRVYDLLGPGQKRLEEALIRLLGLGFCKNPGCGQTLTVCCMKSDETNMIQLFAQITWSPSGSVKMWPLGFCHPSSLTVRNWVKSKSSTPYDPTAGTFLSIKSVPYQDLLHSNQNKAWQICKQFCWDCRKNTFKNFKFKHHVIRNTWCFNLQSYRKNGFPGSPMSASEPLRWSAATSSALKSASVRKKLKLFYSDHWKICQQKMYTSNFR